MGNLQIWVTWIVLITSFVNLILGVVLIVESVHKEMQNFIAGATLVSIIAGLALGTACIGIVWTMCIVSVISLFLSIYFAIVIGFYNPLIRYPDHEERLWKRYVNTGAVDELQRQYHCCGKTGPRDYEIKNKRIPLSCYKTSKEHVEIWEKPCFPHMEQISKEATALLMHFMIAITIIGFIQGVAAQALGIILLDKKKKAKRNASEAEEMRLRKEHDEPSGSKAFMQANMQHIDKEMALEEETGGELSQSSSQLFVTPITSVRFTVTNLATEESVHTRSRIDIFDADEIRLPTEFYGKSENSGQVKRAEVMKESTPVETTSKNATVTVIKGKENLSNTENVGRAEKQFDKIAANDENSVQTLYKRSFEKRASDDDSAKK